MNKRQLKLNEPLKVGGECIAYIMSRDQRVQDNHALLLAQEAAIKLNLPLIVIFNLLPKSGVRSSEHYRFMVNGLQDIEKLLLKLNIPFVVTVGNPSLEIARIVNEYDVGEIFFDFSPLRGPRKIQKELANKLGIPCSVVDTHNIVPLWILSDKEEYAAHTIRRKVHKNIEHWLVEPRQVEKHSYTYDDRLPENDWQAIIKIVQNIPASGVSLEWQSGESAAHLLLQNFIKNKLDEYASKRNLPDMDGQSNLSPYLHFGQISSLRVALELVKASEKVPLLFREGKLASYEGRPNKDDSIDALLEELIVRKELADNYCFYNKNYDNLSGAKPWAAETLKTHNPDDREFLYSKKDWEESRTHDKAWNAAQNQMVQTGKMHGYMRMYWAKKILEWSSSPEKAIQTAVYLNDKYSIDGGDPNGYTGIMWSIAGVHDRPWFERGVYGKIRYMNEGGLKRKFDLESYIKQWTE